MYACNHHLVEKNYPRGTEYHIVATDYDPVAMEDYETTVIAFNDKDQAEAWLTEYFTVTDDIPF